MSDRLNAFNVDFDGYLSGLKETQDLNEPITTRSKAKASQINGTNNNNEEASPLDESEHENEFSDENNNDELVAQYEDDDDESVAPRRSNLHSKRFVLESASESGGEGFSEDDNRI